MTDFEPDDFMTGHTDDRGRLYFTTDMANKKMTVKIINVSDGERIEADKEDDN